MVSKKKGGKGYFLGMTQEDFTKENMIKGGLVRPLVLMSSFLIFVISMLLILFNLRSEAVVFANILKWAGSGIIFSFVLNLYSIYETLGDKASLFKKLNLGFKLTLFACEIIAFNWALTFIL